MRSLHRVWNHGHAYTYKPIAYTQYTECHMTLHFVHATHMMHKKE